MFKFSTAILIIVVFISLSCLKEDDKPELDDSYVIEYGFQCGWCGGTGFITIMPGEITYQRIIPCGEKEGEVTLSDELDSDEWEELLSSYDHDQFLNLEYNQCNVCVDGCDEIIRIRANNHTHEITYSPGDTIPGLLDLQDKLRNYMSDYYTD